MDNNKNEAGIIMTVILKCVFIIITEIGGPYTTVAVANNFLVKVCRNDSVISRSVKEVGKMYPGVEFIEHPKVIGELRSIISKIDEIPNAAHIDPTLSHLVDHSKWKFFMFMIFGRPVLTNVNNRMHAAEVISRVKGVWNGYVSIIAPETEIKGHHAITKGLLRIIYPIQVQDGILDIHNVTYEINEAILFDATFHHGIINRSKNWMMILTLDVFRPLEGFPLAFNRLTMGIASKHKMIDEAISRASCEA